tara:strand:- start:421 stop:924 length:504 start_codon:yes stop_codon:yes gene_type:complete
MKNYYSILQIPRSASQKDIKNKTKNLFEQIKNSNATGQQKEELSLQVLEAYKFLYDYHKRKKLDDYLDSKYKIVDKNKSNLNNPLQELDILLSDFGLPIDLNNNKKSYFYSSSSVTSSKLDKDGNVISSTKEYINNNGKKDKKEFKNITPKNDIIKSFKIKPITFIL